MQGKFNRRNFIKTTAAGIGGASALSVCGQGAAAKKPLRVALIGCGGRGITLLPEICKEKVVALVDPDTRQIGYALNKIKKVSPNADVSKIKTYADYRVMYKEMEKEVDAVVIASTNHHHAPAALLAIRRGIHAYVEKPMALTLGEARQLKEEAKKYGVVTQMGQHGHSEPGARVLCEYIWAGAIGQVHTVYSWSDRANGLIDVQRPPSTPPPKELDWKNWIGPAAYRDYHSGLHRHSWHRWCDFGNGSIGNMGNHILDPVYWALKLGAPTSVENEEMRGGSDEYYSTSNRIRFDFPAREGMCPVKLYWYDGLAKGQAYSKKTVGSIDCVQPFAMNKPPFVVELEKKYDRNFGTNASILVGDKGIMTIGTFGSGARIIPEKAHRAFKKPEATLPRIKGTHQSDFFRACRGGPNACANFDYSGPLVEIVLLGDLAMRAGTGKRIEWDAVNMKCTNHPELNKFIKTEYQNGWKI